MDNNPLFEFHPQDYVNDPFVVAQNNKQVAINSALEVDLTGQVCADSIGPTFFSGTGGQLDFMYGALRSPGGVPIIALPATAKDGTISRIVPMLKQGAGVVTTRNHVRFVVTEYGAADLFARSVRERVHALVNIAAPQFREELLYFAKQQHWI
jgi:4-hydroxybutyrate CoA-transferase